MRIAFMADIHANREAFEACLAHAREQGADRLVFLGDYVNYGADPEWVVATLMDHVARGGIAVLGNHDHAVGFGGAAMSSPAEVALEWTRVQLGAEHRAFLAGLPLVHEEDGLRFVHTGVVDPAKWAYVTDTEDAALYLKATNHRVTLCAHVHKPALYNISAAAKMTAFKPVAGIPVPLLLQRRWLAVVGAVGQPRDGNPAAAYAVLDDARGEITTFRVPYDTEAAAEKIRSAGLPEMLADRLKWGSEPMATTVIRKGATIDGFCVGDLLHEGGMASLRSVTRPDFRFPLLMKIPAMLEGEDPATIVSFEMEQMIVPRLSGVHVPKFVAAGDFAVQPYLVMEHIRGQSLLKKLRSLPLPYEEVAAIGTKVSDALDALHRQHVVHLDVKPSNIIMREETGDAVLVDFGLAHHDQLPDLMEEEFRLPYGTAPYMAPEQILGVRRDSRSDLFALGVLLYFFSTGVRPFGDPKGKRQLQRRLWRDPVPPRRRRPDYPPWLQEIVLRCLEVDPARRHPTAAQLAFDLSHPDQVKLTARSERMRQDSWSTVIRRRFHPDFARPTLRQAVATQVSTAPIVAVAIDLAEASDALHEALRVTVKRVLETVPGARIALLNVLKHRRIGIDTTLDEEGRNKHVKRLVELKFWAQSLSMDESRITFHVLEATDAAAAILEYADTNRVDHIVMGARTNSAMRTILGSVSQEVVAKAPCTVTVVRPQRLADGGEAPAPESAPPAAP